MSVPSASDPDPLSYPGVGMGLEECATINGVGQCVRLTYLTEGTFTPRPPPVEQDRAVYTHFCTVGVNIEVLLRIDYW